MSELANRGSSQPTLRSGWGNMFGFDPFRDAFSNWSQMAGVEIQRTEAGYTVEVPVAGFKPDEINVTLEDNVLTIAGKSDRRSFTRSLVLADEINADAVEAKVEHGLLTLTLPLHPKAQPKKIQVKFSGN